jgi:predicted ABC-type ATPase
MIGGPNGSGKSTLITETVGRSANLGAHFNADEIAKGLSGTPERVALEAQIEVRRRREAALQAGLDYSWATVMSHESHIEHSAEAKAARYRVRVIYVAIAKPLGNIFRVRERVQQGGHFVPEDAIARRYFKSIENLSAALVISDDARVFDDSFAF